MPLELASGIQNRCRDSIVYADNLELAVRANGEEQVTVIDKSGNIYPAEIPTPTVASSFVSFAAGNLTDNKWICYKYVYVAATKYPLVIATPAINESVAPRGNPSPIHSLQITGGNRQVTIQLVCSDRPDIDVIWVFRTGYFDTQTDAEVAAEAGLMFFTGTAVNTPGGGTVNFVDNTATVTNNEFIELDNFPSELFRFVTYVQPYFIGYAQSEFIADVEWNSTVVSLLNGGDQWFDGRDGLYCTVSGITTGGIDNRGTFIFKWVTNNTAYLTTDGSTPETLDPASGTGQIYFKGNATLYRSKPNNPFAWGSTQIIGSSRIPSPFALRVGQGVGTAIISMPGDELLKVDTKQPSACYVFNLRQISLPTFAITRKKISNYAVDAHFSQFYATVNGQSLVWGIDHKNFAILQSDGASQIPVSDPVRNFLRNLSTDKTLQELSHGFYDERHSLNCIVVTTEVSTTPDHIIWNHAPTGTWGLEVVFDLTSSCVAHNPVQNQINVYGGTGLGLFGQIQADDVHDWIEDLAFSNENFIVSADTFSITTNFIFDPETFDQLIGNWVSFSITTLATVAGDEVTYSYPYECEFARISHIEGSTLTFDKFYTRNNSDWSLIENSELTIAPERLNLTRVGIPAKWQGCSKVIDLGESIQNKKVSEVFIQGKSDEDNIQFVTFHKVNFSEPLAAVITLAASEDYDILHGVVSYEYKKKIHFRWECWDYDNVLETFSLGLK